MATEAPRESFKDIGVKNEMNDAITIVTVYSPQEANTYLLDEYLEDPTKAKVLKRLEYQQTPVVRLKEATSLVDDQHPAERTQNMSRASKRNYTCNLCKLPHDPAFKCGEKK